MYIYLGSGRNVSITRIIIVIASIMNSLSSTAYFKLVSRSVSYTHIHTCVYIGVRVPCVSNFNLL